ncbi:hypothetical protein BLNAU_8814 [Blattamonas nauphoetae]|uniref:CID domain-containing protein n=1 Tax=Blattamonas nauphoetae TaxID=2049346 RepID=A0ABQ9XXN9_9EUKA|nr:hypothetical protein BLNAU_8814 [Blattamonas nauphoetae]
MTDLDKEANFKSTFINIVSKPKLKEKDVPEIVHLAFELLPNTSIVASTIEEALLSDQHPLMAHLHAFYILDALCRHSTNGPLFVDAFDTRIVTVLKAALGQPNAIKEKFHKIFLYWKKYNLFPNKIDSLLQLLDPNHQHRSHHQETRSAPTHSEQGGRAQNLSTEALLSLYKQQSGQLAPQNDNSSSASTSTSFVETPPTRVPTYGSESNDNEKGEKRMKTDDEIPRDPQIVADPRQDRLTLLGEYSNLDEIITVRNRLKQELETLRQNAQMEMARAPVQQPYPQTVPPYGMSAGRAAFFPAQPGVAYPQFQPNRMPYYPMQGQRPMVAPGNLNMRPAPGPFVPPMGMQGMPRMQGMGMTPSQMLGAPTMPYMSQPVSKEEEEREITERRARDEMIEKYKSDFEPYQAEVFRFGPVSVHKDEVIIKSRTIWLGGADSRSLTNGVRAMLSTYGRVEDVQIHENAHAGFALMGSRYAAERVYELNTITVDDWVG